MLILVQFSDYDNLFTTKENKILRVELNQLHQDISVKTIYKYVSILLIRINQPISRQSSIVSFFLSFFVQFFLSFFFHSFFLLRLCVRANVLFPLVLFFNKSRQTKNWMHSKRPQGFLSHHTERLRTNRTFIGF